MPESFTEQEKLNLLSEILKIQHKAIDYMTEEKLKDYVELISLFVKSKTYFDSEGALITMTLLFKNVYTNNLLLQKKEEKI